MSIKYRIIRGVIAWINRVDPYILRDYVVPEGAHIHRKVKNQPPDLTAGEFNRSE